MLSSTNLEQTSSLGQGNQQVAGLDIAVPHVQAVEIPCIRYGHMGMRFTWASSAAVCYAIYGNAKRHILQCDIGHP